MDLLAALSSQPVLTLPAFLFVLTVVVFFHELGHFAVARWCGVDVEAFSIGFGRELIGFNDRKGTRWKLCLVPLGGYVKFSGDENEASVTDHAKVAAMSEAQRAGVFAAKPIWQRAAVVAAGPIANFILAIVIFSFIFGAFGRVVSTPLVGQVQEGSAAAAAGLQPGDLITAVDGKPIETFAELQRIVSVSADVPLRLEVEREGQLTDVTVTPQLKELKDDFGNVQRIGLLGVSRTVQEGDRIQKTYGPAEAVKEGVNETWFVMVRTVEYIGKVIRGHEPADQLGGPIRIAEVAGQVATLGFIPLLQLAAVLSVSIGLLNLMPVPMLDGGHLVYYAAEAVRGRPLSEKAQEFGFRIGLTLVLMLMVFATWNDLSRIVSRWLPA